MCSIIYLRQSIGNNVYQCQAKCGNLLSSLSVLKCHWVLFPFPLLTSNLIIKLVREGQSFMWAHLSILSVAPFSFWWSQLTTRSCPFCLEIFLEPDFRDTNARGEFLACLTPSITEVVLERGKGESCGQWILPSNSITWKMSCHFLLASELPVKSLLSSAGIFLWGVWSSCGLPRGC